MLACSAPLYKVAHGAVCIELYAEVYSLHSLERWIMVADFFYACRLRGRSNQ